MLRQLLSLVEACRPPLIDGSSIVLLFVVVVVVVVVVEPQAAAACKGQGMHGGS